MTAAVAVLLSTFVAAQGAEAAEGQLGDVTGFSHSGDVYEFSAGTAKLRVSVLGTGVVRVEAAPDGVFTDPANTAPDAPGDPDANIVVGDTTPRGGSTATEDASAVNISTSAFTLTVAKSPLTLRMRNAAGAELWRETAPLAWSASGTRQSLARGAQEQFFGGGMQNGRFSHRDQTIQISRDFNWNDGGNPNAVPLYLSSNGYGVLRDTFAPGSYAFGDPVMTTHQENRFDAFYMVGDTRAVLNDYTALTGRPALVPMYALEVGDADCYLHNANRGERQTLRDSTSIAQGYADNDMPLGWMLVNDGYGCGYEDLGATAGMLSDHGAELGLWTESDLTEQASEVAAGVRVRKTDVAWVGPGYRFALDACEKARDGIEGNSNDRATVLTVEGWAGTQRCGAVWSGDQTGDWDYIRWQIPTYAGSTMSGQHLATGDIDGIFGGSAQTYVRDLQWKMLLPMTYSMSGWAGSDKQPWRYGEPYTSINRKYLDLHERLLPYLYTHVVAANGNGLGPTRPLYVNYPDDPNTWGDAAKYEFLAGDDFLVAPVYEDTNRRDGIYLPAGTWVDYWTGRVYPGGQTIDGYKAPLDVLPLFVRAGAIVPMFPEGTRDWAQGKQAGVLDLDIYPKGDSSFTLYEDDGRTQAAASGASATQTFSLKAPETGRGRVQLTVGSLDGNYDGKPGERSYRLTVHSEKNPLAVKAGSRVLTQYPTRAAVDAAGSGWTHDTVTGISYLLTGQQSTASSFFVTIGDGAAVGGAYPGDRNVSVDVSAPAISAPGEASNVTVTFTNGTGVRTKVDQVGLGAPQGWTVAAQGPTSSTGVAVGATFAATFRVTPPADASPGASVLTGTVGYTPHVTALTATDSAATTVAFSGLDATLNNVAVTAEADSAPGDIDGGGSSFIAERLAAEGVTPGAQVQANGFIFAWPSAEPGTPDNVASNGQTIRFTGTGNTLALLGTGTSGSAGGDATLHYTDGSSATAEIGFPNWCCLASDTYSSKIAVTTLGKNTSSGPAYPTTEYRLYTTTVPLAEGKTLAAVTLPGNNAVHVFALAVGTQQQVPPPIADGQYALTNVATSNALQAPSSDAAQLTTAAPSTSPSQKWVLSRRVADGTYQLKNAGSGLCVDVFSSGMSPGDIVGQYTCTGTPNQRFVVAVDQNRLTLTASHSQLVVAIDGSGRLVQARPDGSDEQYWIAAAS